MYLCVRGYQVMTESGHVFVLGVSSHDKEWSYICALGGIKP